MNYLQEQMKKTRADDGFTLIELLIVVIILGILAAVVIFSIQGLNDDSITAACRTDRRIMATAEEAYYADESRHTYGDEQDLVDEGFIDQLSEYWNVTGVSASGFTLEAQDPDCAPAAATTGG